MGNKNPMVGKTLTAIDPQPPEGSIVETEWGQQWLNDGYWPCCWVEWPLPDYDYHDPETWTKVAGNYGPVKVIKWGEEEDVMGSSEENRFRRFHLVRNVDVTGTSGTGIVVEGVQFTDGTIATRWLCADTSTAVYADVDTLMRIHGHNGATVLEWIDE